MIESEEIGGCATWKWHVAGFLFCGIILRVYIRSARRPHLCLMILQLWKPNAPSSWKDIIPPAEGKVLEIGVGPGVNFVHYDPATESKAYALDLIQAWSGLQNGNGA